MAVFWVVVLTAMRTSNPSKVTTIVRSEVLTATSMKMASFWGVAPCSVVDTDRRFKGAYYLDTPTSSALTPVKNNADPFRWTLTQVSLHDEMRFPAR
jgi:hypothetical protein